MSVSPRAVTLLRIAAIAVVTAAGQGRPAWAAPALSWDAPADCPTAAAVLANVDRLLADAGRSPVPIAVTTHVVSAGNGWQASLVLDVAGTRTERRFQAENCDAIAEAAALIIAVAAEGEPEPAAAPVPAPPPAPKPRPARPASQGFVLVTGLADWRTLPRPPAAGVEVSAGWRRSLSEHWSARVLGGVNFFPPRDLPFSTADVFGSWWLVDLFARGCLTVTTARLAIGPCLGASMAILHGSSDVTSPDQLPAETEAWLSVSAGGLAAVAVGGSWSVVGRADLVVPTDRPSYGTRSADPAIPLYRVPAAAFQGALGIEWAF